MRAPRVVKDRVRAQPHPYRRNPVGGRGGLRYVRMLRASNDNLPPMRYRAGQLARWSLLMSALLGMLVYAVLA